MQRGRRIGLRNRADDAQNAVAHALPAALVRAIIAPVAIIRTKLAPAGGGPETKAVPATRRKGAQAAAPPARPVGDRNYMVVLEKGLSVIECFDRQRTRLTIAEVAAITGLSRAAARRCLLTLTQLGYTEFNGKFFSLAPRVLRLGHAYLASASLPQILQPFLERLREQTNESSSASVLDRHEIVYIARVSTKRIMSVGLSAGSRLPAYCTSMGRVLLAALPPDAARAMLEGIPRPALTARTVTRIDLLMAELAKVRQHGYCINDQELEVGLTSVAVPVIDSAGQTIAALNIGAPSQHASRGVIRDLFLPRLLQTQASLRPLLT